MRIVYILNTLEIGGTERQVAALAERMAARGHAVVIVALREPGTHPISTTITAHYLEMRKSAASALRGWVRAARILRGFRPHILHSSNVHGNLLARSLKLCCPRARIVSTIHNVYEGGAARMLALRITDPLSHCSVAVSQAAADEAVGKGAVPARKCGVIANGIDPGAFTPDAARRMATRESMGAESSFIWMTAGRIVAAKDYPNLLRAFALVHSAEPEARLWIAGEGDAEYAAGMISIATQAGVAEAIRWLGARRDMVSLLDAADGFVLGSAWEGMPLALAEAMAMEKPVVATAAGGVGELAGDCANLVAAGDAAKLAEAMLATMRRPVEAREAQGRASRERIVAQFNAENKAEEWERLYVEAAEGR